MTCVHTFSNDKSTMGLTAISLNTLRAFDASGKTPAEFADMYGLQVLDVTSALERRLTPHAG